jgi:HAD superfamily hydrolase (TIGR01509 family)
MTFKGVLIDFGGILAYLDEAQSREYEEALVTALKKYGYETRPEELASVLSDVYLKSSGGELKSPQEFWNLTLARLKIPEQPGLTDVMQSVRNNHEIMMWKPYDKTLPTLSILQKKYRLALVSNCSPGTDGVIRSLGLAEFFDCITLSYQVGARKPDKRLYVEALRCLGLDADECVFVADEISDLEGARETGLKTILVLQGHSTFQEAKDLDFKPDFQITQISQVAKIL